MVGAVAAAEEPVGRLVFARVAAKATMVDNSADGVVMMLLGGMGFGLLLDGGRPPGSLGFWFHFVSLGPQARMAWAWAWAWDGDNKRVDFAICFGSPRLTPDFGSGSGLEAHLLVQGSGA